MKMVIPASLCIAVLVMSGVSAQTFKGLHCETFYGLLNKGDARKAANMFAADATYVHTGFAPMKGHHQIHFFLRKQVYAGLTFHGLQHVLVGAQRGVGSKAPHSPPPQTCIATRYAVVNNQIVRVRDSFFFVDGKIQTMMTTKAHVKDPEANETISQIDTFPSPHDPAEEDNVKKAVNVYFDGFVGKNPKQMQSAYVEYPFYMFDFNSDRKTPFGCSVSSDCGTAPYFTSREVLLGAFQGFCQGYIKLNHAFDMVEIHGDLAFATTSSFGCEGDNVTPNGSMPMPNREMFVLNKVNGNWKIASYMFTYDAASPLTPPVDRCLPAALVV